MAAFAHHADMVGSLLRPQRLSDARAQWRGGCPARRRTACDRGRRDRRARSQAGGGRTAGRDRRRVPSRLVAPRLPRGPRRHGHRPARATQGLLGRGRDPADPGRRRQGAPRSPDLRRRLLVPRTACATTAIPKITIPGPGMANLMGGPAVISDDAYPDTTSSGTTSSPPTGTRSRRCTPPGADTSRWTTSASPTCAMPTSAAR